MVLSSVFVVGFSYHVSYKGEARHVRIDRVADEYIIVFDLDKQAFRCFRLSQVELM